MSKLHGLRAEPANCVSEGGRAARGGWPGFPLRRVVGGFLRSSKEGERCKEGVRRVKNSANLLVPRSLGHGSKTVLQDRLKSDLFKKTTP